MHHAVATLTPADATEACRLIDKQASVADWVEVRFDHLWPDTPDAEAATDALIAITDAAQTAGVRVLATLRPKRQGGRYAGPEDVRLGLLVAAAQAGCAVDLESDRKDLDQIAGKMEGSVVVSDHSLAAAPAREDGLVRLLRMQDAGGAAEKLAFPASAFPDALRALELAHQHRARQGHPAIAPIGFGGPLLRALLPLAGNRLTYGHGVDAAPAVSGQPGIADVRAFWDLWGLDDADLAAASSQVDGWYAVLGQPVAHSLSPRIHNAALRAAGRPPAYGALEVPDSIAAMRLLAMVAPRIGLRGASVTAPLKHHALDASFPDDTAAAVGAANCLRFLDDHVHATNTDATALARMLEPVRGRRLAVIGAGGAARAALWAGRELGMDAIFTSRDPERAEQVTGDFDATWVAWDDRTAMRADAWVQATPLGSVGEASPIDAAGLDGATLAVEMVYGAGPTDFQAQAKTAGARVLDGRVLLVEQAVDAYRFWHGDAPDRDAMEASLP